MTNPPTSPLTRRALLALTALGLASCATRETAAPTTPTTPAASAAPTSTPTITPSATPSPTAPAVASKDTIAAAFAGKKPTTWGFDAPGVTSHIPRGNNTFSITFDACGSDSPTGDGFGYDIDIINILREHNTKATLFLNQRWIRHNPGITEELIDDPLFEIANHGTRHVPLSVTGRSAYKNPGTANVAEAYDEIMGNAETLHNLGVTTTLFRPGTAHVDDVAVAVSRALGHHVVGFSLNGDAGTTFKARTIASEIGRAKDGDLIICHFNRPKNDTAEGLREGLPALLAKGLTGVHLTDVLEPLTPVA